MISLEGPDNIRDRFGDVHKMSVELHPCCLLRRPIGDVLEVEVDAEAVGVAFSARSRSSSSFSIISA